MGAKEELEKLVSQANSGRVRIGSRQGQQIAESIASLREAAPDTQYKLDYVRGSGNKVVFGYTASSRRGRWSGSGVATLRGDQLHFTEVNEDTNARRIALGKLRGLVAVRDDPQKDITGDWTGEIFGIDFSMDLEEKTNSTAVTGTISGLGMSLPVSGKNTPPDVSLAGTSNGKTVKFDGQWTGNNTIEGKVSGAGLNEEVTLTR